MKTRDFRSLSPEAQETLRRRAVEAVRGRRTRQEVACLFGVSRQSVGAWVRRWAEGGAAALRAGRRGRPPGGSLAPWEAAQIARVVVDRRPDQLKLPFYLWTRAAVAGLIERRIGIRLSVWTVGRYLRRRGFTPQKPVRRAFEQNPAQVQHWLQEAYPAIRRQAKREKAQIYWGDQMGMRSDHAAGRTYAPRGKTPVIPGTGQRFGCSMISAITNRGQLYFMVFKRRFRVNVFLDFLGRLVRQAPTKVFLIVDRHPVHRARGATRWLADKADQMRLFFLPGYRPELNPDEMLNPDVKSNAVRPRRPRDPGEMISHVRGYLHGRQRRPDLVRAYFRNDTVRYAAM